MILTPEDRYSEILNKWRKEISQFPIINSVIQSKMEGWVYSDSTNSRVFICSKFGWSMLLTENDKYPDKFFQFLRDNVDIPDYIHIYAPSENFVSYLQENWNKTKIRKRSQFRSDIQSAVKDIESSILKDYKIISIQEIDLDKLDYEGFDSYKRYWQSNELFKRDGVGTVIFNNTENHPLAICYSTCVVDNVAEIDVFVNSDYQGKQLGFLVSNTFLNITSKRKLLAHWDAFDDNIPSINLANKLNLTKTNNYNLVSVFLRD